MRGSAQFKKWYRDAQTTLRRVFGDSSPQLRDFNSIRYLPLIHGQYSQSHVLDAAFIQGLENAHACIAAAIDELVQFGLSVSSTAAHRSTSATDQRAVFVVHGRDQRLRAAMFAFLRAIGLKPMEWSHAVRTTASGAPYIGQILDTALPTAQAVVVLITPDDEARIRPDLRLPNDPPHETEYTAQARPNVLFEAGMALAVFPDRTVLVQIGDVRPFSDIAGRHIIHLNNTATSRHALAQRLTTCGCVVDINGTDWHSAGDFSNPRLDNE